MNTQQIIDYIKSSVKNTQHAYEEHDLPYDPQIIKSAMVKELRQLDNSVDKDQFDHAIDELAAEGYVDARTQSFVYFKENILA